MSQTPPPIRPGFKTAEEELAFIQLAVRFSENSLTPSELDAFNTQLANSPAKLELFGELQLHGTIIRDQLRRDAFQVTEQPTKLPTKHHQQHWNSNQSFYWIATIAGCLLLMFVAFQVGRSQLVPRSTTVSPLPTQDDPNSIAVLLSEAAGARFFGELVPSANANMLVNHDYVLTHGLVKLAFPTGATAIIQAPAIFRIADDECLAMDAGSCSVHAPDGAEGFRVETPTTRVVDRGTRFIVSVSENTATEVQVIEGEADVYQNDPQTVDAYGDDGIRLTDRESKRFSSDEAAVIVDTPFSPERYLRQLPDRVVRYDATTDADGRAEDLLSVTVQRNGETKTYSINDLIGVTLTQFVAGTTPDPNGHLACGPVLANDRRRLLSDPSLNTGIINPGGSVLPLTTAPVIVSDADAPQQLTPGFAVQFQTPVINGPGPDLVFFELQCLTNPIDGDAFHVSPLPFTDRSRTHTVDRYDITLESPQALPLARFNLYQFPSPVESLEQLQTAECVRTKVRLGFRAIAVGIDLSDLGFEPGESVDSLFFQDATDAQNNIVDPVFIAGFPQD